MYNLKLHQYLMAFCICIVIASCKAPSMATSAANKPIPGSFETSLDTTNISMLPLHDFFKDKDLVNLIDTAITNNQELLITLQDIEMAKNDIRIRKGTLLPTIGIAAGASLEKVGRYTSQGAGDASTEIVSGRAVPDALTDYHIAATANWEIDIWKKLRNSKKAAVTRYLSTIEGKNFVITNLISEVANSYYELQSYDSQLEIIRQNIKLQSNALEIVKVQKEAARATELAVQKFKAEVLASKSLEFETLQNITETENKINFLLGRYPQEIIREKGTFLSTVPSVVNSGIPAQLLANRPDIKQAELELVAAKLDVKVAKAEFYPSLDISAAIGLQAFKPNYLFKFPESVLYSLAGDLAGPLINRNAIKAEFNTANARQLQAMYNYQRVIMNGYMEVSNQLSRINNLEKEYDLKTQQVDALNTSIQVSNDLFKSNRADYFEVLMTQRDALDSKLELIETKKEQLNAVVNVYTNLGGGWR
jgi:multidrug efflux system outer membrane protein